MLKKTNTRNVTIAMMVATFLAAIEGTIVSTAIPQIASDLSGVELISWVFAIYLLTTAVTTPIYGKLADLFGRKMIFTIGTVLFLTGSMLSGLAQSMEQLIWFRALQGIGAGAVMPITFTIIGDIYSFEERAKIQGLFSGIWGISGIIGPLAGGFLVDYVSWRWIFYFNLPFGIISIIMVWLYLHENFEKKKKAIDYWGAITFTLAISALLFALNSGGTAYAWNSPIIIGLFAIFFLFALLFLWIQSKFPEPMLPLSIFKIPVISISILSSFLISSVLIAITVYIPMWVQGLYGQGATSSGLTLMPMSIGWPLGATIGGRLMVRYGTRTIACIGAGVISLSMLVLALLPTDSPQWLIGVIACTAGFGFGFAFTTFTVSIQSSVEWNLRGAATASLSFIQILGQTVGVATFGTLLNHSILRSFAQSSADTESLQKDLDKLLNPELARELPEEVFHTLREALASGIHLIFIIVAIIAFAGFLVTFMLPNLKGKTNSATAAANMKTQMQE